MVALLEARLLFSICSVKTRKEYDDPLEFVLRSGIDDSLLSSDARECFNWILEQQELEGQLPTVKHLSKVFKGIDFATAKQQRDQLHELVEEFKDSVGQQVIADLLNELVNRPKRASAYDLVDLLDTAKSRIPLRYKTKQSIKEAEELEKLRNYKERTSERIPLPWDSANKPLGGYQLGTLSSYVACMGAGKSWISCINAVHFTKCGLSVGLVSMEDPEDDINERIWSIVGKLNPMRFSDRLVSDKKVKEIIKEIRSFEGNLVVYDRTRVSDLRKLDRIVGDADHDVVIVDAAYLLDCGQRTFNDFENFQKVIRGLELIALKYQSAVIMTSQYGSSGTKLKIAGFSIDNMDTDGVRYGREIEMSSSLMLAFHREPHTTIGQFKIMKARKSREDCTGDVFETNWSIQTCDFSDIGFRSLDDDDGFDASY